MFMADSPDFVTLYLAAMRMGAVPVPVSTMLRADGLVELLRDSRARLLAVTTDFAAVASRGDPHAPELQAVLTGAGDHNECRHPGPSPRRARDRPRASEPSYPTGPDSPAFWLYTSGTTGRPKAAMHRHGAVARGLRDLRVPRSSGSVRTTAACRWPRRSSPTASATRCCFRSRSVRARCSSRPRPGLMSWPNGLPPMARHCSSAAQPSSPTCCAPSLPSDALAGVRLAVSAGEALPAALYERWTQHFGVDIIDGLGMTEMLHIFLSNREGEVRPGTSGVAVPGYDLRIVDEAGLGRPGRRVGHLDRPRRVDGGRLLVPLRRISPGVSGRVAAYRRHVHSGRGRLLHMSGRTNDMLKASGIWVSPAEVEDRLLAHDCVAQAVVVAAQTAMGWTSRSRTSSCTRDARRARRS